MVLSDLKKPLAQERGLIEKELRRLLNQRRGVPARLHQAMRHSLLGGGKRLRPVITLWTWDALAGTGDSSSQGRRRCSRNDTLQAACAIEMLHTYSLIHDDLPAMDDDVLRRGRPTCHVAFDEATAILAGDALQARAFEILGSAPSQVAGPLVQVLARAVGPAGMVGGQQDDLDSEGMVPDARLIKSIHLKKTAALLAGSFAAGAMLGGAGEKQIRLLEKAGLELGLAFQGADDLLDVTATSEVLGKSPGKDAAAGKATWVRLEGPERAQRRTDRHGRKGLKLLREGTGQGKAADRLTDLGQLMWNRDR